jgi:hypothetical protein
MVSSLGQLGTNREQIGDIPRENTCDRCPVPQGLFDDSSLLFNRPPPSRYLLGGVHNSLLGCVHSLSG